VRAVRLRIAKRYGRQTVVPDSFLNFDRWQEHLKRYEMALLPPPGPFQYASRFNTFNLASVAL
jgi:hypothetical protein